MNSKKGRQVDSSIAQAYIQMIRGAEHFIYIENQYFLGSAYAWMMNDDVNCHHTIPSEIAQKIVEKIQVLLFKMPMSNGFYYPHFSNFRQINLFVLTSWSQCSPKAIQHQLQSKKFSIGKPEQLKWCTNELEMPSKLQEIKHIPQIG